MPRASSVSCNLELKTISDCLLWSISIRLLQSLPLAKRFDTFISSWHNKVRHRGACSSVNLTSLLILEAPLGKDGPCQAVIEAAQRFLRSCESKATQEACRFSRISFARRTCLFPSAVGNCSHVRGYIGQCRMLSFAVLNIGPELGGNDHLLAERKKRFAQKFFVDKRAVDFCGIEKGNANLHCFADQRYHFGSATTSGQGNRAGSQESLRLAPNNRSLRGASI
jgi:hypothetical protein